MCDTCFGKLGDFRLVVVAFALDRLSGSEGKIASELVQIYSNSAKKVYILTSSLTSKEEIQKFENQQKQNVTVLSINFPSIFERFGRIGFQIGVQYWHRYATRKLAKMDDLKDIDLGIHVSYGTCLYGTPLRWIGCPYIFGPIGFSYFSFDFLRVYGINAIGELIRNLTINILLKIDPHVRKSISRARIVIPTDNKVKSLIVRNHKGAKLTERIPHLAFKDPQFNNLRKEEKVIWVGNFIRKKNPLIVLEIFNILAPVFPNLTLYFYGKGKLKRVLLSEIGKSPFRQRIHLNEWVSVTKLTNEIAKSEVLLHTAIRETAGNQIIEGVLSGTKVISSNATNIYEWMENPAISFVKVFRYMTKEELAHSYAKEIADWIRLNEKEKENIISSGRRSLTEYSYEMIAKRTLHQFFK